MNFIFMAASNTILDASKNAGIGQFLLAVLSFICLAIDSVVYFAITVAYKLFLALAQFEIFNNEAFDYLINRTYIIIGVVSLFVVAYSLLNSIINPDNAGKGNKSFAKIVKNIVIAIVGVAIVPTIFNYFYYFQRVVLCNNFIPRLILQQVNTDTSTLENIATELPELIFESFFYPNGLVADGDSNDNNFTDDLITSEASKVIIGHSNPIYDTDTYSLADAYTNAKNGYSFWTSFEPFIFSSPGVSDNSIQYLIILSTVAGGYIAYVFLNLCLGMGLRAVKLGYLELIAPLAIMTSIVPGQDGVFKNWSKKTISCAVEVFTRLFVVVFAVYLVGTVKNLLQPSFGSTICGLALNKVYILLLRAIIYCAIFTFAKQAPKFFSEATGIKSDGFKLGIADKLGEMALIGGAAKNGFQRAEGLATGALGGLTTGLANRNKVGITAAIMQGATQGFKGKGNQFLKQRNSTFQSIPGYGDKNQGFFGDEKLTDKIIAKHKKDVEKSGKEKANNFIQKMKSSGIATGLRIDEDNFGVKAHEGRITDFESGKIMQRAKDYAYQRAREENNYSEEFYQKEIENFLNNEEVNATSANTKRAIFQYKKEKDADEVYESRKKYSDQEWNDEAFRNNELQSIKNQKNSVDSSIKQAQAMIEKYDLDLKAPGITQQYKNQLLSERANYQKEIERHQNILKTLDEKETLLKNIEQVKSSYAATLADLADNVLKGKGSLSANGEDYIEKLRQEPHGESAVKVVEEFRRADNAIDDLSKPIDYNKQIVDALNKLNKDK